MGVGSKVTSVVFRFIELISAAVVAGIGGQYLHNYALADADANSRFIYTEVIAGLSLIFSLLFIVPFKHSFYAFILDFILFINWMVAFGPLVNLTGGHGCTSYWYWNNWGYYWGGWWCTTVPTQSLVGTADCAKWQATLRFSFICSLFWLFSGCLGAYVCLHNSRDDRVAEETVERKSGQPPPDIMVNNSSV